MKLGMGLGIALTVALAFSPTPALSSSSSSVEGIGMAGNYSRAVQNAQEDASANCQNLGGTPLGFSVSEAYQYPGYWWVLGYVNCRFL